MRKLFILITIASTATLLSCRDQIYYTGDDVNCYECYTDTLETGYLIIEFTLNDENVDVPITVFSGQVDASPIVFSAPCDTSALILEVPMNAYYSVKAAYKNGNDSIYVVDGGRLEAKLVTGICDSDCWIIQGGEYNVSLNY